MEVRKANVTSDKGDEWTEDFFEPVRLPRVSQRGTTSPGATCAGRSGYFTEGFLSQVLYGSAMLRLRGYSQCQL